jgi:hypothetical protein
MLYVAACWRSFGLSRISGKAGETRRLNMKATFGRGTSHRRRHGVA